MYEWEFHSRVKLLIFILTFTRINSSRPSTEAQLHKDLFRNYNRNIRPVNNTLDVLTVNTRIYLKAITAFNELEQTFSSTLWITSSWNDCFLTWNTSKYDDIEATVVPSDDIWLPDIAIENSVFRANDYGQKETLAYVSFDGEVAIWPEGTFTTGCKTNLRRYPFDTQVCEVRISTWLYTNVEVNLTSIDEKLSFYDFEGNAAWDLIETDIVSKQSFFEDEPYSIIIVSITLRRKYIYALFNTILPTIVLSFLNLMAFHIPAESGEKITYAISMFISLAVFLTVIIEELPPSSDGISVLAAFVCLELGLCALTIVFTVRHTNMFFLQCHVKLPLLVHMIVTKSLTTKKEYENEMTWKQVSRTCDKLLFWVLFFLQIITLLIGAANFVIN